MHNTQPRRSRTLLKTTLLAALGAVAAPAAMAQTYALYDDFASGSLSATKWLGEDGKQFGGIRLESQRQVVSGQLRMFNRGYGDNVRSLGTSTSRTSAQLSRSPDKITAMKATVTMRSVAFTAACPTFIPTTPTQAGSAISSARARLFGFFFNGGTPVLGTNMNDVFATIQVFRAANSTDAAGTFKVNGFVGICTDDPCVNSAAIGTGVDLGTVTVNTPTTLSVVWDAANNRFTFQRDTQTASISYGSVVSDAQPALFPMKRLEVNNSIAQCQGTRMGTSVSADFDNIMTNTLPTTAAAPTVMPMFDQDGEVSGVAN